MRHVAAWACLLTLGCAGDPTQATSRAESLRASAHETTLDARLGQQIIATANVNAPSENAGTDRVPPRELVLRRDGRDIAPPVPCLTGRITAAGAVWLTAESTLVDEDGALLAADADQDLSVSASGEDVAFVAHSSEGVSGVYILSMRTRQTHLVTGDFANATTPLFLPDGRLIFSGGYAGDIAGLWMLDLREGTRTQLTNHGLRVGEPLGATFIPLPAWQSSMRVEHGVLAYDDGEGTRRITLPARQTP